MAVVSLTPQIIYEDNDLLILNKPSGLVVNSSETQKDKPTLEDWVRESYSQLFADANDHGDHDAGQDDFFRRAGIVHRLDKETSGVILVAKNKEAFFDLQKQFKERSVSKSYKTLVLGKLSPQNGIIENKIGRNPKNRMRFCVTEDGKKAITEYKVLEYLKDDDNQLYSLVLVTPKTGRTHQIRVHFAFLGHPAIGDKLYTFRRRLKEDRKLINRQFLHASSLSFAHPQIKTAFRVEAELSNDLLNTLKKLHEINFTYDNGG